MKDKLHCDIVLDLLPSYVEGLTREATNEAVKGHLENCKSCQKTFDDMREPEKHECTVEEKKEIDFLKKTKKKHLGIIISSVVIVSIMCVILFFVNMSSGNPISYFLAKNAAEEYVSDKYGNLDVYVDKVEYDFKMTKYYASVKSDSSIDTHFDVYISMTGQVEGDSYSNVSDGYNTYSRIDMEYRTLSDSVLDNLDMLGNNGFAFGTFKIDEIEVGAYSPVKYGVKMDELELDKLYDIKELAKESGHIIVYAEDEDVTVEKAAEYMLFIKKEMDEVGIPFYAIDFTLEKPKSDDYEYNPEDPVVYVSHFLYSDIYEEGMTERVQNAYEDLDSHYKVLDKLYK